jgi:hypothetical protein
MAYGTRLEYELSELIARSDYVLLAISYMLLSSMETRFTNDEIRNTPAGLLPPDQTGRPRQASTEAAQQHKIAGGNSPIAHRRVECYGQRGR